jgi:hypothetical protein
MDPAPVVAAIRTVVANAKQMEIADRECLAAWLAAFRHHWPDQFATILGLVGEELD